MIPAESGTYVLVLACRQAASLQIGRLGALALRPGFYVYVGSALGPGGLAARIKHHGRIANRPHWHVDHLRMACEFIEVWFTTGEACRDHEWAATLARLPRARLAMAGFGSSDCACAAHLFWFRRKPSFASFRRRQPALCAREPGRRR